MQSNNPFSVAAATSEASMYKAFLEFYGGRDNINKLVAANRVQTLLGEGKPVRDILDILIAERLYVPHVEQYLRQCLADFTAEADDLIQVQPAQTTAIVPVVKPLVRAPVHKSVNHGRRPNTLQFIDRIVSFVGQRDKLVSAREIATGVNDRYEVMRRYIPIAVVDGKLAVVGRTRGTRYQLPGSQLVLAAGNQQKALTAGAK
jgi:hypothetical protein